MRRAANELSEPGWEGGGAIYAIKGYQKMIVLPQKEHLRKRIAGSFSLAPTPPRHSADQRFSRHDARASAHAKTGEQSSVHKKVGAGAERRLV